MLAVFFSIRVENIGLWERNRVAGQLKCILSYVLKVKLV